MRKLMIIALLCSLALLGKAQTIDTAFKVLPACKVTPFLNNPRTDVTQVTEVGVMNGYFDFVGRQVIITYGFYTAANTLPIYTNTITLAGSDYTAASAATNKLTYFFTYLALHLPGLLTYK